VPITNSTGNAWTFATGDTPSCTALGGRFHDLATLMEGGPGGASQFVGGRPGVFTGPTLSGFAPNGLFVGATGTGLQAQVFPGAAVIERGTFSGSTWSTFSVAGTYPYVVTMKSTATFTCDAANSLSGTRIDRVDLQIADGPGYGDNAGTSFARVIYTGGTVGSGSAPNAPANSIPLALITFPAGTTTTLTGGMITDLRRSTAPRGAVRVMLPGDSLSDASTSHGELRDTSVIGGANGIQTLDRWNAYTSVWDTLAILSAGGGYAKYTAAINGTGANQSIPVNASTAIQLINARSPSAAVVASGTNNTSFAPKVAGKWSFQIGARFSISTTGQPFFQLIRSDTSEIIAAESPNGSMTSGATVYDWNFSGEDYFTQAQITAGVTVSLFGISTSGGWVGAINSGAAVTGLRTFLAMQWEGA